MKSNNIFSIATAVFLTFVGASCGDNTVEVPDTPDTPWEPEVPELINGYMRSYPVWGTVTDINGQALSGVSVRSGDCEVTTNEAGFFYLERIDDNHNRAIVKFEKDNYFSIVRSCFIEDYTNYGWQVAMKSKNSQSTTRDSFSSSSSHTLAIGDMSVDLPADGYIVASTGEKYKGTVVAEAFYLSPEADYFTNLMPGGDLAAEDASGAAKLLLSYGMVDMQLSDTNGNRLQIAGDSKATLSFPTPQSMASEAPAEIPLWSFDEATGVWKEEGVAVKNGNGNYVGQVGHFSWWNLDDPADFGWIEGYVTNESGEPLPDLRVIFNNQLTTITDSRGYYKNRVLANTEFGVKIPSGDYGNYTPEFNEKVGPIASRDVLRYDITLPNLYYVYGRVIDQHENPVVGVYNVSYGGLISPWKDTDKNGEFRYYLTPGYEGQASITVFTQAGTSETQDFYIPGDDNVYVEIRLGGGTIVPDQPDIIANCGNGEVHYLNADRPTADTFGGVIIEDSWMTVISNMVTIDDVSDSFMLQIPNYSPTKKEYTEFFIGAINGNKVVQCNEGTLTVSQEGDTYYYSLSGQGYYGEIAYDGDLSNIKPADITVNNVGITHLMTLERQENYTPKDPFKSFVPHLSSPAPVAMVVTKSEKLGTGGFLYYNGNLSDFDLLVNQANDTDYTRVVYDKETSYGEAYYTKGNSIITIDADTDEAEINSSSWKGIPMFDMMEIGEEEEESDPYESQISVTMFNGGTISLDFMWDDEFTRSKANTLPKFTKKNFNKIFRNHIK